VKADKIKDKCRHTHCIHHFSRFIADIENSTIHRAFLMKQLILILIALFTTSLYNPHLVDVALQKSFDLETFIVFYCNVCNRYIITLNYSYLIISSRL